MALPSTRSSAFSTSSAHNDETVTTGACLIDMRWFVILALVACSRSTSPPTIAAHFEARAPVEDATKLIEHELVLMKLPPLPPKRGIDLAGDKPCRAHLARALAVRGDSWPGDIQRLIHIATLTGGDCRIDTDALLGSEAPYFVGGCRGARSEDALITWNRVAIVATTRARRAVALRNVAALAWHEARGYGAITDWIAVGDAYVRAAAADPDALDLSLAAVDAYENALRVPRVLHWEISSEDVAQIDRKLAQIVDGSAGDRARALRARLQY
jgi:hypothetical protein